MTSLPPRVYSQATELKAWLLRLVLNRNFPRDQIPQDNRVSPVGIAPEAGNLRCLMRDQGCEHGLNVLNFGCGFQVLEKWQSCFE